MKKFVKIGIFVLLIIVMIVVILGIKNKKSDDNGNVSNMGLALQYKNVTYYNKYEKGIFAVKGSEETQLTDETAYSLTFYEDRIYYMTVADFNHVLIKYVDVKTRDIKNIATIYTSISKFFIEGNAIYYFTNNGENGLCRMDLNGENEEVLLTGNIQDFQVYNHKIFYINEKNQICEFVLKNQENIVLNETIKAKKFQIVDSWIYYYNETENALFRLKMNSKKLELVSILVNNEIYNVCGKYVYYYDEANSKIARMQLKKSNKCNEVATINILKTRLNVAGDVLYYLDKSEDESQNYQMYRVKLNGDEVQKIKY